MVLETMKFIISKHPASFENQSFKKTIVFFNTLKILYIQNVNTMREGCICTILSIIMLQCNTWSSIYYFIVPFY